MQEAGKRVFLSVTTLLWALSLVQCGGTAQERTKNERGPATIGTNQDRHGSGDLAQTVEEKLGREIWYKATAGNKRFYMYTFPQRIAFQQMNWWRFIGAQDSSDGNLRSRRFNDWGLMNDPDCCTPGKDCQVKGYNVTIEETFGFDYCAGDEKFVWPFVGRTGYRDPACDLSDGKSEIIRESACHLEFGASAGAVGFRKFPNPRFRLELWRDLQKKAQARGKKYAWEEIQERMKEGADGSIEMPYLFGISCAACHASFDPANPPANLNHPDWANIKGLVGNQYMRSAQIFGSGYGVHDIQWQALSSSRPGIVDTSAIPNDYIANAATMNAIIGFAQRPQRTDKMRVWDRVQSCSTNDENCMKDPNGNFWQRSSAPQDRLTPRVLKGGEDSVGYNYALQRVFFNIGSCSEQCWANHLPDFWAVDPQGRNYGQTPFDIGQCRRDCPQFRAVEDRVESLVAFLASQKPFELYHAMKLQNRSELISRIENNLLPLTQKDFQAGDVAAGEKVFKSLCVRCHSSQTAQSWSVDALNPLTEEVNGVRSDWLGNDKDTPARRVGTNACRSLHTNHQRGHIWEEFASETVKDRGSGYYRNISLLSLWAFAPFAHNNAIGPEVCGGPNDSLYVSPYSGTKVPQCLPFDPSVEGRLRLFELSLSDLLHPQQRSPKVQLTTADVHLPLLPALLPAAKETSTLQKALAFLSKESKATGLTWVIPKGVSSAKLGNFRYKDFIADMMYFMRNADIDLIPSIRADESPLARQRLISKFGERTGRAVYEAMKESATELLQSGENKIRSDSKRLRIYLDAYSNCDMVNENAGHYFGADFTVEQKRQLKAFLITL